MWSRFAKKIFFSLKHTSPELLRMWSRGAEMTRDLWLANGRKDAATYQLTRVGEPISIIKSGGIALVNKIGMCRHGRRRALTC